MGEENEFVIETYKIFELTDRTEYVALTGTQTKDYNLILSIGKVDMSEGSIAQVLLWTMFPEETVTGTKFRNPANGLVPSADIINGN